MGSRLQKLIIFTSFLINEKFKSFLLFFESGIWPAPKFQLGCSIILIQKINFKL